MLFFFILTAKIHLCFLFYLYNNVLFSSFLTKLVVFILFYRFFYLCSEKMPQKFARKKKMYYLCTR